MSDAAAEFIDSPTDFFCEITGRQPRVDEREETLNEELLYYMNEIRDAQMHCECHCEAGSSAARRWLRQAGFQIDECTLCHDSPTCALSQNDGACQWRISWPEANVCQKRIRLCDDA